MQIWTGHVIGQHIWLYIVLRGHSLLWVPYIFFSKDNTVYSPKKCNQRPDMSIIDLTLISRLFTQRKPVSCAAHFHSQLASTQKNYLGRDRRSSSGSEYRKVIVERVSLGPQSVRPSWRASINSLIPLTPFSLFYATIDNNSVIIKNYIYIALFIQRMQCMKCLTHEQTTKGQIKLDWHMSNTWTDNSKIR